MTAGASISVSDLSKHYGAIPVLRSIGLDIGPGEFVTLLGPSGSGKSTLLNIIAGFERPSAGQVLVEGADIVRVAPHRRGFGMVFQNYALFPNMTIQRNVAFPLRMAGVAAAEIDRRVAAVLALLDLSAHIGKLPAQLSGGQQQRVAIARAIVGDPKVILMDEPLSALDKKLRENIQLELKALHAKIGSTFLFVTHDQSEALTMSDRIAVMNDGHIAQFATPDEIYRHPANEFVARFIGESNLLPVTVATNGGGVIEVVSAEGTRHRLTQVLASQPGAALHLLIRPENVDITAPCAGLIPATVTSVVYMGEILRVEARTATGQTVLVRSVPGRLPRIPAPGDSIGLGWAEQAGWLVP